MFILYMRKMKATELEPHRAQGKIWVSLPPSPFPLSPLSHCPVPLSPLSLSPLPSFPLPSSPLPSPHSHLLTHTTPYFKVPPPALHSVLHPQGGLHRRNRKPITMSPLRIIPLRRPEDLTNLFFSCKCRVLGCLFVCSCVCLFVCLAHPTFFPHTAKHIIGGLLSMQPSNHSHPAG